MRKELFMPITNINELKQGDILVKQSSKNEKRKVFYIMGELVFVGYKSTNDDDSILNDRACAVTIDYIKKNNLGLIKTEDIPDLVDKKTALHAMIESDSTIIAKYNIDYGMRCILCYYRMRKDGVLLRSITNERSCLKWELCNNGGLNSDKERYEILI